MSTTCRKCGGHNDRQDGITQVCKSCLRVWNEINRFIKNNIPSSPGIARHILAQRMHELFRRLADK